MHSTSSNFIDTDALCLWLWMLSNVITEDLL